MSLTTIHPQDRQNANRSLTELFFLQVEVIEKRCLDLFSKDYTFSIIHNANGEVCGHYPRKIVFLEYQATDVDRDRYGFITGQVQGPVPRSSPVSHWPVVCFYHPGLITAAKGRPPTLLLLSGLLCYLCYIYH